MSTSKCDFCNNEYTNNKILKNHQKTAIFCKNIQNVSVLDPKRIQSSSDSLKIDNSLNFKCEHCRDTFTQKITLKQHYERIAVEGQEYDPYTTVFAKKKDM